MVSEKTNRSTTANNENMVGALTNDINTISNDVKYSTGIQLVYTGLLMSKYADLVLSRLNLNVPRIILIFTLIMHGGSLKARDLAKLTFRSKQNVSVIIEGLLKNGLVSKQLDAKDHRSSKVVVTRKGMDLARTSLPIILEVFTASFSIMDEKRIQNFQRDLKAIRKTLYKQFDEFAAGKALFTGVPKN
jgi:DNA-binding MarR family transcriptional regulator